MRWARRLALAASVAAAGLGAGAAVAQAPLPDVAVSPENRARFLLCRAAISFHLDDDVAEASIVPRAMAESLLEQINLIVFETIRNAPAASLRQSGEAMAFVEAFFMSLPDAMAENRDRLEDTAERERILLDCQPFIWSVLRERIDYLFRWRERAVDAPAPPAGAQGRRGGGAGGEPR